MFGGLYGDLPDAKGSTPAAESSASGWGALQLRVPAKRPTPAMPSSVLRAGRGRGAQQPAGAAETGGGGRRGGGASAPTQEAAAASLLSANGAALQDEYDPSRPNDYATIRRRREEARKEAEQEAERQEAARQVKLAQQEMHSGDARDMAEQLHGAAAAALPAGGPAVPVASGEEAHLRRARLGGAASAAKHDDRGGSDARGMSLAAKMMEKMGWRGGGLGRQQQGMATPLIAQKRDGRSGIITHADEAQPKGTPIQGRPSKVILLRNMVGPGEVDATLEDEVGTECTIKYGAVSGVVIFEVTEPNFPAEQAVRIFVAFDRQEAAIKAAVDLGGRFFGGRQVQATFYSEERFQANDFAPKPGEDG